jgi:hypothetical protein
MSRFGWPGSGWFWAICSRSTYLCPNSGCQLPTSAPTVAASYLPLPQQWLPVTYLSPNSGCQLLSVQVWLAWLRLVLGNLQPQYLPLPQQWLPATYLCLHSVCQLPYLCLYSVC